MNIETLKRLADTAEKLRRLESSLLSMLSAPRIISYSSDGTIDYLPVRPEFVEEAIQKEIEYLKEDLLEEGVELG